MVRKRYTPEQIINKLREAKILIEEWRREYNHVRPHGALGNVSPLVYAATMVKSV